MKDDKLVIKCPYCGAEYTPSELFYPNDFIPEVKEVVKDESGNIVAHQGALMKLDEEYCCDYCNHTFVALASILFTSKKCDEHDFNFEHVSPLYNQDRIKLEEK